MFAIILVLILIILILALLGIPTEQIFAETCIFLGIFITVAVIKSVIDHIKKKKMISNGGYKTPFEYEQYVASLLISKGYSNVEVTKPTGDYGADVICRDSKGVKWAVQCKYYSKPVGYRAVEEALGAMHVYGCDGAMVVTNSTYTKQALTAAKRAGVVLYEKVT